ncbi:alpha/beta hydrolase [Streptomyces sp. NRRL B-12105]|uniref:alpha/beta hydrolase n=2 Tax=Streptomyces TaxID=1883 RepID=UPI000A6D4E07|nr:MULTISPECIES: alpha/beta hydrolase [unclassified Streptomyces]
MAPVFVLVPGMFTDAHVWEETARRLTAAGAEARAVTLAGPGRARAGAGPVVDLEAHIRDVCAAIDAAGAPDGREVVLVGHDYGVHPVLGAADRRAGRVARIVFLDAGMPQDGVPPLAAVPDQSLRARLAERAAAGGADGELPPPAREEWPRWGSTAGVPEEALDRLTARAAPQPLGTLFQPLRLTGAAAAVPTTGVLCTASGVGIAMVQRLVDLGDPALRALAAPGVTFFELPTGHWPMLSCPADLADVLLRAAAGEGHGLTAPGEAETPAHLHPFPLPAPELPRERRENVDLYVPEAAAPDSPRPAVLFVHGGPVPAGAEPAPRDWPVLTGHARYAAGQGVVGAVVAHRLHDVADYARAAADVAAAVDLVRADPRVDAGRIALWFFSGGGPLMADWLAEPPAWLRCLGAAYPVLAPLPNWGMSAEGRFHPVRAVADAGHALPPLVLLRVGRESPEIAATVAKFLRTAAEREADVRVVDVPHGHHGGGPADPADEWRAAVREAMRAVVAHVTA